MLECFDLINMRDRHKMTKSTVRNQNKVFLSIVQLSETSGWTPQSKMITQEEAVELAWEETWARSLMTPGPSWFSFDLLSKSKLCSAQC